MRPQDLVGEKVRLSARNLNKVVLTFLKTEAKVIQMWMESEDGKLPNTQIIRANRPAARLGRAG